MTEEMIAKQRARIIGDCEQFLGQKYDQYKGMLLHPAYRLARVKKDIQTKGGLRFRKDDLTLAFRHIDWDAKEFGQKHDAFCVSCYSVRSKGFVGIYESEVTWIEEPSEYRTQSSADAPVACAANIEDAKKPLCQHSKVSLQPLTLEAHQGEWPTTITRTGNCLDCGAFIGISYVALSRPRKDRNA